MLDLTMENSTRIYLYCNHQERYNLSNLIKFVQKFSAMKNLTQFNPNFIYLTLTLTDPNFVYGKIYANPYPNYNLNPMVEFLLERFL